MTPWSKGYGEQQWPANGNWKAKADQTAKRKRRRLWTKVTEQAVSSKIVEMASQSDVGGVGRCEEGGSRVGQDAIV